MKKLFYTFRTVPIEGLDPHIFIFKQLKTDLERFVIEIETQKPDRIIGIGNASTTQYEPIAINRFHRTKKIVQRGPEAYELFVPDTNVAVANQPTDSFCNWTAYQIAHYLQQNQLDIKLSLLHVHKVTDYSFLV